MVKNGWSYNENDDYVFYLKCKACEYEYNEETDDKFNMIEGSFISIIKETYDYYETTTKYDLYICPKCGTVIAIDKEGE